MSRQVFAPGGDRHAASRVALYDSIAMLPPECGELFSAAERDSFDLSRDWYGLLESKAASPGTQPRYCLMERDNQARCVLPLFFRRVGIWGRQGFGMTNFYSSLYRPLLAPVFAVDELAYFLRKLMAETRVDSLRFDAMDPNHPSFALIESAARRAGLKSYRFFCFGNWYLPVEDRSYREYYQGLSSRVRNTIRRSEKKFLANDRGKLELVTGSNGLEEAIAAWERIYRASWKQAEPFPEFVPGLIRLCAERGWLRLGIGYYDGEPVAAQLWIVSYGRAVIYKLAYDEKVAKLSVGTVLTAFLMARVLDVDKVREVDYLVGDDAYKKDWMSHRRERWGIVAYDLRTVRGSLRAAAQLLSELTRRFRSDGKNGEIAGP